MAVVTMKQLLEAGVQFGHQTRRWNPKMKRFIHGDKAGIHIVDLRQTLAHLERAYVFVRDLVAGGGMVLFIGTKKQAQDSVQSYAERCNMPYVNERWQGGMLTNFHTIAKRIAKMKQYQRMRDSGEFDAMPKKEALLLERELTKLERNLGGIRDMMEPPGAVFILDTKKEYIAVTEARKLGVPIVAVVDTNCDPDLVDYAIPGNDDAIRSGRLMARVISDAVLEGRFIHSKRTEATSTARDALTEAEIAEQQALARAEAAAEAADREARVAGAKAAGAEAAGAEAAEAEADESTADGNADAVDGEGPEAEAAAAEEDASAAGDGAPTADGDADAVDGEGPEAEVPRPKTLRPRPRPMVSPTPTLAQRTRPMVSPTPTLAQRTRPMVPPTPTLAQRTRRTEMAVSARDVKTLRDVTGAGMMDAKRALTAADGDMEAARQILREQGLAKADARTGRDNDQGAVAVAGDGKTAAVVQLKCETDFSAKNEGFTSLVQALAESVLDGGPGAVDGHSAEIEDLRLVLKENIEIGVVELLHAADGNVLDSYLHRQDGRGVNVVVVEGSGVDADALHQVALHVAFAKPQFLSASEIPSSEIERERDSLLEITKAEGKPEKAWDKIVDGRLRGWYAERVLLAQGLHGEKTAVKDSIGAGSIIRFVQVMIGD